MPYFSGNSYYLLTRVFFLLIPPLLIGFVIYQPGTADKLIYAGIFIISIFVFFILKSFRDLVVVKFYDHNITIKYLIIQKEISVPYSNLVKWYCFDGQKGQHYNIIRFKTDNFKKPKKIKIDRIARNKEFIAIVKWFKTKNENIEFKIAPSDSKLKNLFKKEFE